MTERVPEVPRMKQEAWLKWVKKPNDNSLKAQYQQLKAESRKAADEAHELYGGKPRQKRLRSCMRLQ